MRVVVAAVGRAQRGPEAELVEDYRRRIDALAATTRIGPAQLKLVDDRSNRGADVEAEKLIAAAGAEVIVALDEHGAQLDSVAFARKLETWRDAGTRDVAFLIGGADGHGAAVFEAARMRLALGAMTWPHQLARVMVFEQIYRAATILAGHPYHRA